MHHNRCMYANAKNVTYYSENNKKAQRYYEIIDTTLLYLAKCLDNNQRRVNLNSSYSSLHTYMETLLVLH